MTRLSDKDGFRAMVRYFIGMVVGQAVSRHLDTPEDQWLTRVQDESLAIVMAAEGVVSGQVNDRVEKYLRDHLERVLAYAPKMRAALRAENARLAQTGDNSADIRELINRGATLSRNILKDDSEPQT